MNQPLVDQIANAVLYEGYLLYPYRPSVKNRQRWTFGGLYPRSYSEAGEGTEPWRMRTECLVAAEAAEGACPALGVRARFLHLQERRKTRPPFHPDDAEAWQEAVEREVDAEPCDLAALINEPRTRAFSFPARREQGPGDGPEVVVRRQEAIAGAVEVSAARVEADLYRVTVEIRNESPYAFDPAGADRSSRDEALLHSLVSTHAILTVRGGAFVSLLDPPGPWREAAAGCRNVGSWPVLVGAAGERDTMLSSPIILYDYPRIAPESQGDLFDSTEIDEILTLRILTLTDAEKQAMAGIDDRARALLERTESLAREQLMGLHGTCRSLKPV